MILSASRRTDIPAYFSEWFFKRIEEGYACVRNPMNAHQVSRIKITPDVVDCIVFWTKNAKPMLGKLDALEKYKYYFQYTITAYGRDMEPNVPDIETSVHTFQRLSEKIGANKVFWRYDPILFSEKYTPEFHLSEFEKIAEALDGYTEKCIISFLDIYPTKNKRNMERNNVYELDSDELHNFARRLAELAGEHGMRVATCAEAVDLEFCGIEHNSCIDRDLIESIVGYSLDVKLDGQRSECRCVKCEEIGAYNTCLHGCRYCYASRQSAAVQENCRNYDVDSPLLCDKMNEGSDNITDRPVKLLRS